MKPLSFAEATDVATLQARVAELEKRLEDAEITISKIGFCDPAPYEAYKRYTRKYGSLRDKERKVISTQ